MRAFTKKFDFEKGRRRAKLQTSDYKEQFKEQGDNFERGGVESVKLFKFQGRSLVFDKKLLHSEDKQSLISFLEHKWKFSINGQTGSVSNLLRNPTIAGRVAELFELTRRSIIRSQEIVRTARHPKKGYEFAVVEFKCFLKPAIPLPDPIFRYSLAFSAKLIDLDP